MIPHPAGSVVDTNNQSIAPAETILTDRFQPIVKSYSSAHNGCLDVRYR